MNATYVGAALLTLAMPFATTSAATATQETSLTLTISTHDSEGEMVDLTCDPPGGRHPNAKSACTELQTAQGDFESLVANQEPANCTMEYRPVTAQSHGTWQGDRVHWTRTFSNPCTLLTATGTVFRF